MLILSRKKNEQIVISDDIVVTVLAVEGDKVKIGIDAPKKVKVFRKELIEEVKSANNAAAENTQDALELLKQQLSEI